MKAKRTLLSAAALLCSTLFPALVIAQGTAEDDAGVRDVMASLARESDNLAIPQSEIVAFISLGTYAGLSIADVEEGLEKTGMTAHEAKYGRDDEAAAAMSAVGLTVQYDNGRPEVGQYLLALSAHVAAQTDPYSRARVCELLGCTALLPVLVQGPAAIRSAMDGAVARGVPR